MNADRLDSEFTNCRVVNYKDGEPILLGHDPAFLMFDDEAAEREWDGWKLEMIRSSEPGPEIQRDWDINFAAERALKAAKEWWINRGLEVALKHRKSLIGDLFFWLGMKLRTLISRELCNG